MNIVSAIGGAAFLLVQIFAISMFFIIRFHFKNFAAPGDRHAATIVRGFGIGLLVSIAVAGFALLNVLS